jgi:hypothetical protein
MRASHDLARVSVSFDDDTLLPNGGLAVAALLAQKLGVADLIDAHVTINGEAGANSGAVSADASQTISWSAPYRFPSSSSSRASSSLSSLTAISTGVMACLTASSSLVQRVLRGPSGCTWPRHRAAYCDRTLAALPGTDGRVRHLSLQQPDASAAGGVSRWVDQRTAA